MQELDNEPIARALVRAKLERGVDVEVFLEQDYLREALDGRRPRPDAHAGRDRRAGGRARACGAATALPLDENRRLLAARCSAVTFESRPTTTRRSSTRSSSSVTTARRAVATSAVLSGSANFTEHRLSPQPEPRGDVPGRARVCREYGQQVAQLAGGTGRAGRGTGRVPARVQPGGRRAGAGRSSPRTTPPNWRSSSRCSRRREPGSTSPSSPSPAPRGDRRRHDRAVGGPEGRISGAVDPGQGVQGEVGGHPRPGPGPGSPCTSGPRRSPPSASCTTSSWSSTTAPWIAGSFNYTAPANQYNDRRILS